MAQQWWAIRAIKAFSAALNIIKKDFIKSRILDMCTIIPRSRLPSHHATSLSFAALCIYVKAFIQSSSINRGACNLELKQTGCDSQSEVKLAALHSHPLNGHA